VIRIADVLARLQSHGLIVQPVPATEITVTGVSDDSREVKAGDLYCAIRGYVHDGHRYLEDVAEAGAAAALVETPEPGVDLPQFKVADSRRAAAIAAQVVFGDPAADLKLVGVTGTNGKTTTVHLARHILSQRYRSGSLGTLGVIGATGECEETGLTTPGPIEFARRLAELKKDGVEYVVAEISSHALSQGRVDGVAFDVGVFTNLSRDHLDYHADFDEYRATKTHLAELIAADGTVVVNADDPAWSDIPDRGHLIRYGLRTESDYMASDIKLGLTGSSWTLVSPEGPVPVTLPLPGEFNVSNALAASAVAGAFDFEATEIAESLATAPPVPGRLEVLSNQPFIVRDYAHTPDALRRALEALRPLVSGKLIVVFGCGGDRDAGKRPLMGQVAAQGADYSIVTTDNPRSEGPQAIIDEILPGLGSAPHEVIVDRRKAISRAIELADAEDAVVLAGKGHEVYQIIGDDRKPFDEALIVEELLSVG